MNKGKFLLLGVLLLTAIIFFLGADFARAQSSRVAEQVPRSHDEDAIIQKRLMRMTHQQRAEAAKRIRAAQEAADPTLAIQRAEARDAAGKTAEARVAVIRDPKAPGAATRLKNAKIAAAEEARARAIAASHAEAVTIHTVGGTNE